VGEERTWVAPKVELEMKKPRRKRGAILTRSSISNDEGPVKKNSGYGLALVSNGFSLRRD